MTPSTPQIASDAVDIIVPIYNEAASLDELFARVSRLGLEPSLLFVDNGSSDGGPELIERRSARLLRHERNLGYGASIRHGLAASRAPLVVILDADLEYPPEAVPSLVDALARHPVVYASRFAAGPPAGMAATRRLGNRLTSGLFNLLFGQRTTDLYTGMKGLRREVVEALALRRDGFEHVVELGAQVARLGHRIHEVPVTYTPRTRGDSKMRHLPEASKFLALVVAYWVRYTILGREVGPAPGGTSR